VGLAATQKNIHVGKELLTTSWKHRRKAVGLGARWNMKGKAEETKWNKKVQLSSLKSTAT